MAKSTLGIVFFLLVYPGIVRSKEKCLVKIENCVCDDSSGYIFYDCAQSLQISIVDQIMIMDCKENSFFVNISMDSLKEISDVSSAELKNCVFPLKTMTNLTQSNDDKLFLNVTSLNLTLNVEKKEEENIQQFEYIWEVSTEIKTFNVDELRNIKYDIFPINASKFYEIKYQSCENENGSDENEYESCENEYQSSTWHLKINLKKFPNLKNLKIVSNVPEGNLFIEGVNLEFLEYHGENLQNITLEHNNLTILDLSSNNLTYFVDIIFENKATLKQLSLAENSISEINKTQLETLEKLEVLDLHGNLLKSFDAELPNLISLDLIAKFIDRFIFEKLVKLKFRKIGIDNTFLKTVSENVKNIRELQLELIEDYSIENANNMKETINLLNINPLVYLEKFSVRFATSGHNIYEFKKTQTIYTNLKYLEVIGGSGYYHDFVFVKVNENSFNNFVNLERLTLSGLKLETFAENVLINQSKLLEIDLSHNYFTNGLPEGIFNYSRLLVRINLEMSEIAYLEENLFAHQNELLEINLSHNMLEKLPDKIFENNINLIILDITNNQLETLSENIFKPLQNLVFLKASLNYLKSFPSVLISSLPNLRFLDLEYNQLTSFDFMQYLETLNKPKMSFIDIHKSLWKISKYKAASIEELERKDSELKLENNKLVTLNLTGISNILNSKYYRSPAKLFLNNNKFHCYCEMMYFRNFLRKTNNIGWRSVECDSPKNDLLVNYSDKDFGYLENCSDFCSCFQRCFEDKQVHVIDCSSQELSEIPVLPTLASGMTSFELIISDNNISEILFKNNKDSVSRLIADNNKIKTVSSENLPSYLELLDVRNNSLSKLDSSVFNRLQDENVTTYLSGNYWECDYEDQSFLKFTRDNKYLISDYDDLICYKKISKISELLVCK